MNLAWTQLCHFQSEPLEASIAKQTKAKAPTGWLAATQSRWPVTYQRRRQRTAECAST